MTSLLARSKRKSVKAASRSSFGSMTVSVVLRSLTSLIILAVALLISCALVGRALRAQTSLISSKSGAKPKGLARYKDGATKRGTGFIVASE
jgi:hypothetical protein